MDRVAAGVDDAKVQRYRYVNQYACVADYEDNITAEVLPKQYSKRKTTATMLYFAELLARAPMSIDCYSIVYFVIVFCACYFCSECAKWTFLVHVPVNLSSSRTANNSISLLLRKINAVNMNNRKQRTRVERMLCVFFFAASCI